MKKYLGLLLSVMMIATSLTACSSKPASDENAKFKAGTYTAQADGYHGAVKVQVEVDANAILSVEVVEHEETQGVGTNAIEKLPNQIVEYQSLAVDTIAGCTLTSNAIIQAVEAALIEAGADKENLYTAIETEKKEVEDATTDIVIVGAGGSGMSAAIEATNAGKKVILIEKAGVLGGTTALATTAYNAGGSSVQNAMETPFTADDFYVKMMGADAQELNPVTRVMADRSGADADWLISMGADMNKVINGSQHVTSDGSSFGSMLVNVLKTQMEKLGIDYRLNTKGTELVVDGDKVVGVNVETPDCNYTIHADAVILTTGGFASNPDFVDQYTPQWSGYPSTAAVGATGDGITMGLKVGAAISNMGACSPQAIAFDTGNSIISLAFLRYNGAILINNDGVRFDDEMGSTVADSIKDAPNGGAYVVIDQSLVDESSQVQEFVKAGYFQKAETIEELAQIIGADASVVNDTIAKYQTAVETGNDEEFGRTLGLLIDFKSAPYYAAWVTPANQTTLGGLVIDNQAHVLREDGSVITGLYAGGETTSSQGAGLTRSVTLGRLAGETSSKEITK